MSILFENIKKIAKKRDMNIYDIADVVGVSAQSIYNWNKSTKNIRLNNVEQVADALNVSPSYLLGWENNNINNDDVVELTTLDNNKINFKGVSLSEKEKEIILNLLDTIRK